MIKKILFVSLLLAGGTLWASAQSQTTEGAAASLPVSKKENMTISQLFQKVEDNSKSLRTSLSEVEAAHLGIESAKSKKLPDLDASLSFSYIGNALITDRDFSNVHGLKSPHFGNNFAFQAQQVVYAGGAINAGIKLAELGKLQAEVGVKLTRQQIRFIALGQYLDLYKIDNRIKVYENYQCTQLRGMDGCHRRLPLLPFLVQGASPEIHPSAHDRCGNDGMLACPTMPPIF